MAAVATVSTEPDVGRADKNDLVYDSDSDPYPHSDTSLMSDSDDEESVQNGEDADEQFLQGVDTPSKFHKLKTNATQVRGPRTTELDWAAWRAEESGLGEELLSVNEFSGTAEDASLKFLHSLKTNVTTEQLRSVSEALFGSNGTASLAASGNLPGTSASGPKPHAQGAVGVTNPGRAEQLPCQTQLGVEAAVGAAGAGAIGAAGAAADGAGKDDVLSVQDLRDIAKK